MINIKTSLLFLAFAFLASCATPSDPTVASRPLQVSDGVLIFSTVEHYPARKFEGNALRVANAFASLGLSESMQHYSVHFSKYDGSEKVLQDVNVFKGSSFYVDHSVKTKDKATTKKWHIIALEPGKYILNKVVFGDYSGPVTTNYSPGAIVFDVEEGEATYLGDLVLTMTKDQVVAFRQFPRISNLFWHTEEAEEKLAEVPGYPMKANKAKIAVESFRR